MAQALRTGRPFGATHDRGIELGTEVKPATLPPTERLDALKKNGFDSMF
jgi:hypothetical protein